MSDPKIEKIEQLKHEGELERALKLANSYLASNPNNKEVLIQIADIEYKKWEISRAEKPIDYLLEWVEEDAMSYYIKGVLQMEKTNRQDAKKYFKRALSLLDGDNPEILRCYGLCDYRLGHRSKGIKHIESAHKMNGKDAEILLNLIEISIMEQEWWYAKKYIRYYRENKDWLDFLDKPASYYDEKVELFARFIFGKDK